MPALTGLGERAHLATPEVDVSTHVRELVDLLETSDASDVVLVGHSYSGVVVTAVAAALPNRVSDVVYLDAFVPEEGRSIFDLLPPERVAVFEDAAREHGSGWNVPLPWERAIAGWGVTDPDDVAWMTPLLTPQPLATFHERAGAWATKPGVRRTFVHCLDKPARRLLRGLRRTGGVRPRLALPDARRRPRRDDHRARGDRRCAAVRGRLEEVECASGTAGTFARIPPLGGARTTGGICVHRYRHPAGHRHHPAADPAAVAHRRPALSAGLLHVTRVSRATAS